MEKHRMEKLVDMMVVAFNQELERMKDYAQVNGRPVFNIPLTDEEQIQRFLDPITNQEITNNIRSTEGEKGVLNYLMDINKKIEKRNGSRI